MTVGVAADAVLGGLLGLCIADEPQGVKREMIRMFGRLVHGMQTGFLAHQGVIRAIAQLLHHCIRLDQRAASDTPDEHGDADEALLDLVCDVAEKLTAQPSILRLFVELGAAYTAGREGDPFLLFTYLVQHLHHTGDRGFRVRTATLDLLRTMLAYDAEDALLQYTAKSHCAEALSASTAAAYGLLPMHVDAGDGQSGEPLTSVRARRWHELTASWATTDFAPEVCTWMDLLWLTQQTIAECSAHARSAKGEKADQLEQLRVDILQQFRTTFLENVVYPSVQGCSVDDGSAAAVLLYHALLFSVLDPCASLSRIATTQVLDDRSLSAVVAECIALPGDEHASLRILALRLASLYSRRVSLRDAALGTLPSSASRDMHPAAPFAAMVQSMQTPRSGASLPGRFLHHLAEVEQTMRMDPDYAYADRISFGEDSQETLHPMRHTRILREPVDMKEHFVTPLLTMLCRLLVSPLDVNVEVTRTFAALCRSPYVALEGFAYLHDGPPPPLTYVLFMLVLQSQAYVEQVPDFAFYLAQRRNQLLAYRKGGTAVVSDALACPFVQGSVPDIMDILRKTFAEHSWPTSWSTSTQDLQLDIHTPALSAPSTSGTLFH